MFGPWIVAFSWLREHTPTRVSALKPHFNFITIHYMYLIGMTLLGSILLYPAGEMPYIDALFFASGSATQSGLNTIDINKLYLYQQVVMMLLTCLCTPIFINTFVVFIRLYWFEKRFQHVVMEARNLRKTRTRSRTRSEAKADMDREVGDEEFVLGNREIRVLREGNGQAKGEKIEDEGAFRLGEDMHHGGTPQESGSSSTSAEGEHSAESASPREGSPAPFSRDVVFADEVPKNDHLTNLDRVPEKRSKEHHIAFVENQRNPKDKGTLRIPGPRDFDRGFVPERIEEGDASDLQKETSNDGDVSPTRTRRSISRGPPQELNSDDHPFRTHITIDDPDRPDRGNRPSAYRLASRALSNDNDTPNAAMQLRNRARSRTFGSFMSKAQDEDPMPYLSWTPTVGRNSAFVDLTEDQREELGGIEYRSLKLLAIILVCYYVGFHLLGMVILLPWLVTDKRYSELVVSDGVSPVWWGFFTPASMFNDLGFTLTPDSMISFNNSVPALLLGAFLIIIGNTGFPCMLRFIIWLLSKAAPYGSGAWEELRFLLDHPRRCFTLLFPSSANWWLFWVLIILNGIDLIFFVILDLNDEVVTSLSPGFRFLNGLFQAASTRTAGFASVNLAELHPAIQVSYMIMMYISVFPIAISMRQTNVYEEKSLGVWSNDEAEEPNSYLSTHLRRQLSFDLWFVFLGFFLIAIVEGSRLENTNDYAFTLFSVLFEIVSAYGTVGLSLGYPGINASFSAEFKPLSKLIIIAMQLRGRHRGLPYALDRAILLPSESLHKKEDEDATKRARRGSHISLVDGDGSLVRTGTGLSRRGSNATAITTESSRAAKSRSYAKNVGKFFAGGLNAGPSISREKRA